MRLLLIEDDRMIGDSLRAALRGEGWAVDWVRDTSAALAAWGSEALDLVLRDLGLPPGGRPGAPSGPEDGLAARRQQGAGAQPGLLHGGLSLDSSILQVTLDGAPLLLSAREFAVLEDLMQRPGAL